MSVEIINQLRTVIDKLEYNFDYFKVSFKDEQISSIIERALIIGNLTILYQNEIDEQYGLIVLSLLNGCLELANIQNLDMIAPLDNGIRKIESNYRLKHWLLDCEEKSFIA